MSLSLSYFALRDQLCNVLTIAEGAPFVETTSPQDDEEDILALCLSNGCVAILVSLAVCSCGESSLVRNICRVIMMGNGQ